LYINNIFVRSVTTAQLLTDTIIPGQYGEFRVKAIAWAKPAFAADSFFYYVRKPIITEPLPSGFADGINYTSDTSVALVLHAPYKTMYSQQAIYRMVAREKGYMKRTPTAKDSGFRLMDLNRGKSTAFSIC